MIRAISSTERKEKSLTKGLAIAGAAGAAVMGGLSYAGQKLMLNNVDEFIPELKETLYSFGRTTKENVSQKSFLVKLIQNLENKKITKSAVGAGAAVGALIAGGLYLAGKTISHAYNSERGSLENNTLKVGLTGGIIAGLFDYVSQKLLINELKSLKESMGTVAQISLNAFARTKNISKLPQQAKLVQYTTALFGNASLLADNVRVYKRQIAGSFVRGGVIMAAAYAAARGITSLLFKPRQPKVKIVEVPDEILEPEIVDD